jgi:hypothetical protein
VIAASEGSEAATHADEHRSGDAAVAEALRRLPPEHRHVLLECRRWSVAEAAARLSVSPRIVKSRIHFALRALRLTLKEVEAASSAATPPPLETRPCHERHGRAVCGVHGCDQQPAVPTVGETNPQPQEAHHVHDHH